MGKRFGKPVKPAGPIAAPDEHKFIIRFSPTAGYVDIVEELDRPVDGVYAAQMLMGLASEFLRGYQQQRSMLVGQGKGVAGGDTTKENDEENAGS